jgi:PadR family transcriptional regulator, regulatory protein PadR
MIEITKLEEIVLIAIWNLKEDAYGVNIKKKVRELMGKEYFYNTLYTTFDQLIRKELIIKDFGEPTPVRGGKRKVFFQLTKDGRLALHEAYKKQRRIWAGFAKESFFGETS